MIEEIKVWFKKRGIWYSQSKPLFFLFLFILLIGIFLIFPKNLPFTGGEFHSVFAVKGIIENWIPKMPSGVVYLRSFISHYLEAASVYFFGMSEFAFRLPVFLLFFPFVFLFFTYIEKTFNLPAAFFSLFLLITSGWFLRYVQSVRFYSLVIFLIFFSFYFFDRYFLKNGGKKHLWYFLFFSSLAVFNSRIGFSVFFFFPLFFLIDFFNKRKDFSVNKMVFPISFFLLISIISEMIPHKILDVQARSVSQVAGSGGVLDPFLSLIVFDFDPTFITQLFSWFPILIFAFILGVTLILIGKRGESKKAEQIFPFSFFILTIVFLSVYNREREPVRIISFLSPFFYIGAGVFFSYLFYFLKGLLFNNIERRILFGLLAFLILILNFPYLGNYLSATYSNGQHLTGPLNNYYGKYLPITSAKEQIEYVNKNRKPNDKVITLRSFGGGWDNYYLEEKATATYLTIPKHKADRCMFARRGGELQMLYHNTKIISDFDELADIIKNSSRVWIVTHDLMTDSDKPLMDLLEKNKEKAVFIHPFNSSHKVYLFNS